MMTFTLFSIGCWSSSLSLDTVPAAQFGQNEELGSPPLNWLCDPHHYCDGGWVCCPHPDGSFGCAGTGADADPFATCALEAKVFCRRATAVVCGKACCSDKEMCIAETCAVRPAMTEMFRGPSRPRDVGATAVGWAPPFFAGGLLREVALDMHDKVFPVMVAFNHRRDSNDLHALGQCYVVGCPSSLAQCPMNNVFDKCCRGEVGELEQVDQVVIDDPKPRMSLEYKSPLAWCNDDPHQTQVQEHVFSQTDRETHTVSFSEAVTTKVGLTTTVGWTSRSFRRK